MNGKTIGETNTMERKGMQGADTSLQMPSPDTVGAILEAAQQGLARTVPALNALVQAIPSLDTLSTERAQGAEGKAVCSLIERMQQITSKAQSLQDRVEGQVRAVCSDKVATGAELRSNLEKVFTLDSLQETVEALAIDQLTNLGCAAVEGGGLNLSGKLGGYHPKDINPTILKSLTDYVAISGSLTSLDLEYNGIGSKGGVEIAKALKSNGSLTEVNLDGFVLPIKKLKGTDPVKSLDLSHKGIGVASVVVVASLIGANGSLTSLDLMVHGNIGPECGGAIGDALRANSSLTTFNLKSSGINLEGGAAIAEGLKVNVSLSKLNMSVEMCAEVCVALAEALKVNGSLTSLIMLNNKVGKTLGEQYVIHDSDDDSDGDGDHCQRFVADSSGVCALVEALKVNVSLTHLDLKYNGLDENSKSKLRDAVQGRSGFNLVL